MPFALLFQDLSCYKILGMEDRPMYVYYNPNPERRVTNDCVIRAVAKMMDMDWLQAHAEISEESRRRFDTMDANHVWIGWFVDHGFRLYPMPNKCPECYTVRDFSRDHPWGDFILGNGRHVVAVIDGDWYDSFDSGDMVPSFCMRRIR